MIGAGFGRTGTGTLKKALEMLGFGPCHHMFEILNNQRWQDIDVFVNASQGLEVDWRHALREFRSTMDFPSCLYYKQLMKAFPDAKVILTARPFDDWYDSVMTTIWNFSNHYDGPRLLLNLIPFYRRWQDLTDTLFVWTDNQMGLNKTHVGLRYEEWVAEVKAHVPPERLLVFSTKDDGWKPLCDFLGVPVPDAPFPHENKRMGLSIMVWIARGIVVVVPLLSVWLLYRCFGGRSGSKRSDKNSEGKKTE